MSSALGATSASAARKSCTNVTTIGGGWYSIKAPEFPVGRLVVTNFAVEPYPAGTVLATNGEAIMISRDGGCNWATAYETRKTDTGGAISDAQTPVIDRIVIPRTPAPHFEFAILNGNLPGPHIIASRDHGAHWQDASNGLPQIGTVLSLAVSPARPSVAYAQVVSTKAVNLGGPVMYKTTDGGASWSLAADTPGTLTGAGQLPRFTDLEVGPGDPNDLWASDGADGNLYHSTDGAASWTVAHTFNKAINLIDVAASSGQATRIFAFATSASDGWVSIDTGKNWKAIRTPNPVESIAVGASSLDVVVSTALPGARLAEVFQYDPAKGTWNSIRDTIPALYQMTSDLRGHEPIFYGTSGLDIEYWDVKAVPPKTDSPLPPFDPHCDTIAQPPALPLSVNTIADKPAVLGPSSKSVALQPGASKTVPYGLKLPPINVPVDVYFLMDTSGSMQPAICSLEVSLASIAATLSSSGLDVHIGLGQFKDYPTRNGDPSDFAYKRVMPVQKPSTALYSALDHLEAAGGGDEAEAQLAALYQAATGAGQDLAPAGHSLGDIPPGQDAGFRRNALKVIVNVTDAPFHSPPRYPGPTWSQTANALNSRGIVQVGVHVVHNAGDGSTSFVSHPAESLADLKEGAALTGAVSTNKPVDCDGDSIPDLPTGSALVCPFADQGRVTLAPAIVGLLSSLKLPRAVQLKVTKGQRVVAGVSPSTIDGVDFTQLHNLDFKVDYHCPQLLAGQTTHVVLSAIAGGVKADVAKASVHCKGNPPPVPQIAQPLIAVGIIPAIPPPPPIPITEAAPASNFQPIAQPGHVAQGAMAEQEQQQPQLAFVHAANEVQNQEAVENAMVRVNSRRDPLAGTKFGLAVGALGMIMVWGFATAVATRVRTARVWSGRR
ncbi:MAG: hypothetical protein M3290_04530 [Actinomycetota bacterium]|nr:hypothetical protein [Actinomycetota bacterium]